MGVRRRIGDLLLRPVVEETLDRQQVARDEDLRALRRELEATGSLEQRLAALEKKVGMVMGAVQAATADLVALREAAGEARQAMQQATSARSTAESAADGVSDLEDELAALQAAVKALKSAPPRKKKAPPRKKKAPVKGKPKSGE